MPTRVGPSRTPRISRKTPALLAAALIALGAPHAALRAQPDLATLRGRVDSGDPDAMNALANAYANGTGVAQNFAEALKLYQQAADRGLPAAQFNLGMMHELGRGTAPNAAAAFHAYLRAAQQGFAPAQFNVGNMYANGNGVAQDYFEAAIWFRQAADRQVPEAQYNLALAYEMGRGVGKDEAAAQRWYRAAAEKRYARAQYNLALMLEEGRGSDIDPAGAAELYRAAALQNFAPAQNNLGILLAEGRGVAANPVEAYAWLSLAAENGTQSTGRDIVSEQLSPEQKAAATAETTRLRGQLGGRPAATPPPVQAATPAPGPATSAPGSAAATSTPAPAASDETAQLRTELAEARARLAVAEQADRGQLENANRAIAELAAKNESLAKDLDAARQSAAAALATPGEAVRLELQALQEQTRRLESQIDDERRNSARELAALAAEFQGAREASRALTEANRSLLQLKDAEDAGFKADLERATARAAEAERQAAASRQGAEAASAEAEKAREAAAALRSELSDTKRRLAEAQGAASRGPGNVAEPAGENSIVRELEAQLSALRGENSRLAESERAAEQESERRAAALLRDLTTARFEISRLNEAMQALERDRNSRVAQLEQENAAANARLRQAQGALDHAATAARPIAPGSAPATVSPAPIGRPRSAPTLPAAAPTAEPRVHVVAEGESLSRISLRYYGTSGRWQEIYHANRDILSAENVLRPGQRLRLP